MTVVSAALAVVAVLVWRPPWGWIRTRIDEVASPRPGRRTLVLVLAAGMVASLVILPAAPAVLAWTGLGVVAVGWRRLGRARDRRRRADTGDLAHGVVDALVAELRSGAAPATAVGRLALESDLLAGAATAAASGGDVAAALIAAGDRPGARPLADIGRAWAVSDACGAPLAAVLDQLREAGREDRELQRELVAGVAPARATATLVAVMPPLGLALGTGLGVDPLAVVTTTLPGALCVAAGVAFALGGVLWIDLIADRAEAQA